MFKNKDKNMKKLLMVSLLLITSSRCFGSEVTNYLSKDTAMSVCDRKEYNAMRNGTTVLNHSEQRFDQESQRKCLLRSKTVGPGGAPGMIYQATKYFNNSKEGMARVGTVSYAHHKVILERLGLEYLNALRNGTPLPDIDDTKVFSDWAMRMVLRLFSKQIRNKRGFNQDEMDLIKEHIRPAITGQIIKTAILPYWLAQDFENYTNQYADKTFGIKYGSGITDHIARYRGYTYILRGRDTTSLKNKWDSDFDLQGYLNHTYITLDPTAASINAAKNKIDNDNENLVTHISIHATDMARDGIVWQALDTIFNQANCYRLTLVVNFDHPNQTDDFMVPDSIRNLVIIGRDLTTIGNGFLTDCRKLRNLQLPAGLTSVGNFFLDDCSDLMSLQLPAGLTTVGNNFLNNCKELGNKFFYSCPELQLPVGLTSVGNFFLFGCSELRSLDLSPLSKLTSVGNGFLYNCSELRSLDLTPLSKVTSVGNGFLFGCRGLRSLDLSPLSKLTLVGNNFLYSCVGLISLDLSPLRNVTTVGDWFLFNCSGLQSLDLTPLSKVTSVGNSFLRGCTWLQNLQLPAGLTTVGNNFLFGCSELTTLSINFELFNKLDRDEFFSKDDFPKLKKENIKIIEKDAAPAAASSYS